MYLRQVMSPFKLLIIMERKKDYVYKSSPRMSQLFASSRRQWWSRFEDYHQYVTVSIFTLTKTEFMLEKILVI